MAKLLSNDPSSFSATREFDVRRGTLRKVQCADVCSSTAGVATVDWLSMEIIIKLNIARDKRWRRRRERGAATPAQRAGGRGGRGQASGVVSVSGSSGVGTLHRPQKSSDRDVFGSRDQRLRRRPGARYRRRRFRESRDGSSDSVSKI